MCAYQTKDGHRYENAEIGRTHDRSRGHEPKGDGEKKAKSAQKESEESEQPIEEIVKAHGPAHKTEIEQDGEQHMVTSHHEDGHKHKSGGHSLMEAHEHSMKAHGGEGMEQEEPEGADDGEGAGMPAMGSAPPGMPAMG